MNFVNPTPFLPNTGSDPDLLRALFSEFIDHALRLNGALVADGSERAKAPIPMAEYAKAALPSAVAYKGAWIMVTDDVGGYTAAISDGTNWRRMQDRNIIS